MSRTWSWGECVGGVVDIQTGFEFVPVAAHIEAGHLVVEVEGAPWPGRLRAGVGVQLRPPRSALRAEPRGIPGMGVSWQLSNQAVERSKMGLPIPKGISRRFFPSRRRQKRSASGGAHQGRCH